MISLDRCRQALPPEVEMSDAELEALRQDLYWLAESAVDMILDEHRNKARRKPERAPLVALEGGKGG